MDLSAYARFYAAMEGKSPSETDAVLASLGETREALEAAKQKFDRRLEHDTKLRSEMAVRVLIARAERKPLRPPTTARRVRATRCFRCGGYKRTEPRTAYVYCDYCGTLFDYDDAYAHQETGLDDATLFNLIVDGVREQLRRTFAAKDFVAYREAWRWAYDLDMILFAEGWSPRVRDPAYRKGMVEFSVETCVLQNQRTPDRGLQKRLQHTFQAVQSNPSEKAFADWVKALQADGLADVVAYEKAGFFHLHPDKPDADTWARIGVSRSVMALRGKMSEAHFAALMKSAGFETIEVEPVAFGQASCGHCGGALLVVEGAKTLVCEACGHEVNRGSAFPCPTCGAHLLVTAGQQSTKCAWCTTVISVLV